LLAALRRVVREEGIAAIIVEQNARKILAMTDRAAILERGSLVHQAASGALRADHATLERFLGVAAGATPRRAGLV
jgi:branched-chain amino acid transport system ATP-binding protein